MRIHGFSLPTWQPRYLKPLVLGFLILVAYLAAINRAQALPWGMAALLTATLITGIFWPHWLVKRLSVTRTGPKRAAEGDTITFLVEVRNHGWLPRFMVELVDRLPFVGAAAGVVSQAEKTLGVVAYVPGGGRRRFEASVICEKRGFYRLGPVGLASSFPLGLVEVQQHRNEGVQTLTVYPSVFPIINLPLSGAPSQIHRGGYLLPQGAGAAEFSGLREYLRGDNPRHVHWLTTARRNELMVKEFEPLASACLYLALDLAADANVGNGRHATLEYAIRITASMANFACTNGIRTRVIGQGQRTLMLSAGIGVHHFQGILDELAVVDSDGATPYATVLENVAVDCQPGETVVVFLSEPEARSERTFNALTLVRARGAHLMAVAFERESFLAETTRRSDSRRHDTQPDALTGLLELGVFCRQVRRGDDLFRLFNP